MKHSLALAASLVASVALVGMIPASARERNLTWNEIALEMGCPRKAHTKDSPDGRRVIEYVPKGETVDRWTRLFTVQQMRITTDDREANAIIHELIRAISDDLKRRRVKPTTWQVAKGNHGEVLFTEFTVKGEWNVMIAARMGSGIIGICSLAGRGGAPTPRQKTVLRSQIGLS